MTTPVFKSFEGQILYFNGMYKLPVAAYPNLNDVALSELDKNPALGMRMALIQRILNFKKTLDKEVVEHEDIIKGVEDGQGEVDILVEITDWLVDIQIYCASELAKYGVPLAEALDIVMRSNFSKLDANGQPIYDAEGKVLKGPNYYKPEPELKIMIERVRRDYLLDKTIGIVEQKKKE